MAEESAGRIGEAAAGAGGAGGRLEVAARAELEMVCAADVPWVEEQVLTGRTSEVGEATMQARTGHQRVERERAEEEFLRAEEAARRLVEDARELEHEELGDKAR
eukprot:gene6267-7886_t